MDIQAELAQHKWCVIDTRSGGDGRYFVGDFLGCHYDTIPTDSGKEMHVMCPEVWVQGHGATIELAIQDALKEKSNG